ncbi:mCG146087, partial [Mus musculus]
RASWMVLHTKVTKCELQKRKGMMSPHELKRSHPKRSHPKRSHPKRSHPASRQQVFYRRFDFLEKLGSSVMP